jgi:hypothetical protein
MFLHTLTVAKRLTFEIAPRPSNMWLKLSAVISTEFESTLISFYSTANWQRIAAGN